MGDFFVQSNQVVNVGSQFFIYPNYSTGVVGAAARQLNCANVEIVGSVWLIPYVQGTRVVRYNPNVAANSSTPPTADSIKGLVIKNFDDDQAYTLAITNTDNTSGASPINQFAFLCNGPGGTLPEMPSVTIPFPIIEQNPSSADANGDNTFTFALAPNPNGLIYSIPAPTANRQALSPAYSPSATTPAGVVTWANTNWGGYGVWSNPSGNILKLISNSTPPTWVSLQPYVIGQRVVYSGTGYVCISAVASATAPSADTAHWTATGTPNVYVQTAGLISALQPGVYCINQTAFSTPAAVNGIAFGSGTPIALPSFLLTNNNLQLPPIISAVITDPNLSYAYATANKLTIYTTLGVPKLTYNGATVVTATSGICS